jgi:hypothetical protein
MGTASRSRAIFFFSRLCHPLFTRPLRDHFWNKFQKMGVFWNPLTMPDAALVKFFLSVFGKMAVIGDTSQKMAEN